MMKFPNSVSNAIVYTGLGLLALGIIITTVVVIGAGIMFIIGWVS